MTNQPKRLTQLERIACAIGCNGHRPTWEALEPEKKRGYINAAKRALLVCSPDPGHDATEGVVAVGADRSKALAIWNGIIGNILKEDL